MRFGSTFLLDDVTIDCSRASKAKSAARSPLSVAHEYVHIITNIFRVFLGIQPTKTYLLNRKKNRTMYYKSKDNFGIFGHVLAAIGMNETSKRGALHHHLCAWLGLTAKLIEVAAAFPLLVNEVEKVINSQFKTEIDEKYHILDMLRTFMINSTIQDKPKLETVPPSLLCRPCSSNKANEPNVSGLDFKDLYSTNVMRTNIHKHSFTCFKGGTGKAGCRMGFPQPIIQATKPVQLETNKLYDPKSSNEVKAWKVCHKMEPLPYDVIEKPQQERITIYELQRRSLPKLPHIPRALDEARNDEEIKNYIIKILMSKLDYHPSKQYNNDGSYNNNIIRKIFRWLEMLKGATLKKLYTIMNANIEKRNGLVVPFNDVLTTTLGCNTSVQFLGNAEQSKNTLYYLVPYLTKDNVSLSNCIPTIQKTYDDVIKRKSVAKDSGTDTRFALHIGTRLLNQLDNSMEISDTQASAVLIGMGAVVETDKYWYINPSHHIHYVKMCQEAYPDNMNFNETDEDLMQTVDSEHSDNDSDSVLSRYSFSSDSSDDGNIYPEDFEDTFIENTPHTTSYIEDEEPIHQNSVFFVPGGGSARIYKRGNSLPNVQIQDPYHYFYRGEHLSDMSRLEYYLLVRILERKSSNKECNDNGGDDGDNNERSSQRGIKAERFEFAPGHILFHSHIQMLKFFQPTPIISNPIQKPKHPVIHTTSESSQKDNFIQRGYKFAIYFLTLFRPETEFYNATEHTNEYKYDWNAYQEWIQQLRKDDTIISYCRLAQLSNHVYGMNTNTTLRTAARHYRERERRLWTQKEINHLKSYDGNFNYKDNEQNDIDCEDHLSQLTMSKKSERSALELTTYVLTQLSLLHVLSPIDELLNNQKICSRTGTDCIFREGPNIDLNQIGISLLEQNTITMEKDIFLDHCASNSTTINFEQAISTSVENELKRWMISETEEFIHKNIEEYGKRKLSPSQKNVIFYWIEQLCILKLDKHFKRPSRNIPLILLLGQPGTGKSFVIDAVTKCVSFLKLGNVLKTAHYGVAAMNIGGFTLHKLFKILFYEGGNSKKALNDQELLDMQRTLKSEDLFMLIIDEISNVPPHLLQRVNSRLQQLRNRKDEDFGGLTVMLVGDFLQKKPPGSTQLVEGLIHLTIHENTNPQIRKKLQQQKIKIPPEIKDVTSNTHMGLTLFQKFHLFILKEQQRASQDIEHTEFINKLSEEDSVINTKDFDIYKTLSVSDMKKDFLDASFIVATNRERISLSFHIAKLYSILNKCPIIRWRLEINGWMNRPSMDEEMDLILKDPLFYDHFIKNMDGFITDNLNVSLMIGNGTKIKFHSLSFETMEDEKYLFDELKTSYPGKIITLMNSPKSVNVEIDTSVLSDEVKMKLQTLNIASQEEKQNGKLIIPIFPVKKVPKVKPIPTILTSVCITPSRVHIKPKFPLQLAAAMTVDKAQGRTINKVVACLSCRGNSVIDMDINSIFVSLSRVRKREDLRLLIHNDSKKKEELEYISAVPKDKSYFSYLKGFKDTKSRNKPKLWCGTKTLKNIIKSLP